MYEDGTTGKTYHMGVEIKKKKEKKQRVKKNSSNAKSTRFFMKTRDFDKLQSLAKSLKKSACELEAYTDTMCEDATTHYLKNFNRTKGKVGDILDSITDDLTSFIDELYPNG